MFSLSIRAPVPGLPLVTISIRALYPAKTFNRKLRRSADEIISSVLREEERAKKTLYSLKYSSRLLSSVLVSDELKCETAIICESTVSLKMCKIPQP